ncbi:actin-binding protein WASF2-like [Drosophila tropicalis]|uniref:actin-binding protein WASF2-like n=1 Tax=Drosophila tropicalis TaxID=46794 RepID=UPI0035AB7D8D
MYNPGYQVDVIDPYYPPPVEVIEFMPPPPPAVEVIMPPPAYGQPTVVIEQPYGQPPPPPGPSQGEMECCLMLGACCVMEECGLCVIS